MWVGLFQKQFDQLLEWLRLPEKKLKIANIANYIRAWSGNWAEFERFVEDGGGKNMPLKPFQSMTQEWASLITFYATFRCLIKAFDVMQ